MMLHACKHSNQLCSVIFVNFFNNDIIMSSLVSTGNCILGHDCRRVCSHRRYDATRQFRRVGVGGVYWALVKKRCHISASSGLANALISACLYDREIQVNRLVSMTEDSSNVATLYLYSTGSIEKIREA